MVLTRSSFATAPGPIWPVFAAHAERSPDAPALVSASRRIRYAELLQAAESIAQHLLRAGIGHGDYVGLFESRSVDAIIAMLGILRVGAAFVPLDPSHAPEQLGFIARDLDLAGVLVADRYAAMATETLPEGMAVFPLGMALFAAPAATAPDWPAVTGEDAAYVMYTSGTTGEPKGVVTPQRAITAFVGEPLFETGPGDVVLHANTIACDGASADIWQALLTGAACAVVEAPFPALDEIAQVMIRERVSTATFYAGLNHMLIDHRPEAYATLRRVTSGGDVMSPDHARRLLQLRPDLVLVNGYGPTETTVLSLGLQVSAEMLSGPLPIGRAFAGEEALVLDEALQPAEPGVVGQLALAGQGVALGYHNRPEKTAEVFVSDPRPGRVGRIYLTGDLARQRADGCFEFHGRADRQVKLAGRRIELDGVEHVLRAQPGVADAVVGLVQGPLGDTRLAAVLRPEGAFPADIETFQRAVLAGAGADLNPASLPRVMLTASDWPLTPAGKTDRRALLAKLDAPQPSATRERQARAGLEEMIADIWHSVLGGARPGPDMTFFDAGGSSIQLIAAHAKIEAALGRRFDVTLMFETPRLGDLAARLAALAPEAVQAGRDAAQAAPSPAAELAPDLPEGAIAIIGMAGRFPGAESLEDFWQKLRRGESLIERFDPAEMEDGLSAAERADPAYVPARSILPEADLFDAKFFGMRPREAAQTDPQARIFLEICAEALERAAVAPAQFGRVGVFAGASLSTYLLDNLLADRAELEGFTGSYQLGDLTRTAGNVTDCLATRVAFKLNLRGPALSVATACSTSLTAVAQAMGALRSGQADVALAGGVSITFPQKRGYLYQSGGMASADGLCRPFDAQASGTVFGHGAGVVVLKRLADALRDGDTICAVIRGVGITNDGADKIAYTAPSVAGQAEAIRAAHRDSGVDPDRISYIECHGTATPLGDPIEVAGLAQAFGPGAPGQVVLGAVKGNIGHLDAAAGVAGLIKTTLMLRAAEIPPVAHFTTANPAIPLEQSRFRIADRLQDWPSEGPRLAGVSAFGVGGTNVHLVLEEAPKTAPSAPKQAAQLLPLSAASPEALTQLGADLADALSQEDAPALADVAFTLQAGRRVHPYRMAVAATDPAAAIAALRKAKPAGASPTVAPPVAFLFPGQGAQYPGMGAGLYAAEPVFKDWIDRGIAALRPLIDVDLEAMLCYGSPSDAEAARALRDTRLTQPALLLTEVATARLWQARGVVPQVMIGHSVGEFAAAVLAGVMSYEDALTVIAARGRLMQDQPGGAMLSVRATLDTLRPYLGEGLDLAAQNAPQLQVVAGPDAAIATLEARLSAAGIATVRLHTSHAFHSAMMDPVVPGLERLLSGIQLNAPQIPIISSVTGLPMSDDAARSPAYWAAQARATVQFEAALRRACADAAPLLIEVGPGRALASFAAQGAKGAHAGLVQSLPDHRAEPGADCAAMMAALGAVWAAGVSVDFASLTRGRRRVALPTHPMFRQRHWIAPPQRSHSAAAPLGALASSSSDPVAIAEVQMPTQTDRLPRLTQELLALLSDLSGEALGEAEVQVNFLELGFDSLFMGQVATALGKSYGVEVSFRSLLSDMPTVAEVAAYLDGELPPEVAPASAAPVTAQAAPAAPVATPASMPVGVPTAAGDLAAVMQAQMATMQSVFAEQLRLLSGGVPAVAAPAAAPISAAPAPAPVAPKAVVAEAAEKPAGFKLGRGPSVSDATLTPAQRAFADDLARRYSARFAGSKAYTARHRAALADPRSASGFHPDWKELTFPIVAERSKGAYLWDVDGNQFVDIVNGFGQTAFGHSPDFVSRAVAAQMEKGYAIGPQAELAGPLAERLCTMLGHERVTFCNTGSEAVMAAMRIARAVTGREKIVVFGNDYHGQFDEVLVKPRARGGEPAALPIAPGIPRSGLANMVVLSYGAQEALDWIAAHMDEIAAVIVEPVQSRHPELRPEGFVHDLRRITAEGGAALVMDEVVTGFRTHARGMQGVWGIEADMATYGKVVGGGMPIGLLAGKRRFLDTLDGGAWSYGDASGPEVAPTFFAGTFVRHPLVLAAIGAVMDHLDAEGERLWQDVPAKAQALVARMNAHLARRGLPDLVTGYNGWFVINVTGHDPRATLLFPLMRMAGVHVQDGYCGFLTTVHSEEDIDKIAAVFEAAVDALQSVGILAGTAELAALPAAVAAPAPDSPQRDIPLTEGQREIWMVHQMGDRAAASFNEGLLLAMDGPLDPAALEGALADLVARRDALRMQFDRSGTQFAILDPIAPALPLVDLSGEGDPDAALAAHVEADAAIPVTLTSGLPLRAQLYRLGAARHVLALTVHHIAADGWSFGLMVDDLIRLYSARKDGSVADLAPAPRFADHALRTQSGPGAKTLDFWRAQFADIPALPELPADHPRPAIRSFNGATVTARIGAEQMKAIRKAGAKQGATLFATLFAGLQITLGRLSGARDVVLCVPSAGQAQGAGEDLVGHLVNLLPIRAPFDLAEPASAHLKRASVAAMAAFDHQDVTFGTLISALNVPRALNRMPLSEVQFNLERLPAETEAAGLQFRGQAAPKAAANFDLFVNVAEGREGLLISVDYNSDVFDGPTVARWMGHYATVLTAIADDPQQPIGTLPLLSAVEMEALAQGPNATAMGFDRSAMVQDLVARGAALAPDALAVEDADGRMSHAELGLASDRLAAHIQRSLPEPGARIAVALPRGAGMLIGLLAVLKAGHTYVPLDPRQPETRLKTICETAEVAAVLAEEAAFAAGLPLIRPSQAAPGARPAPVPADPERAAYIIFTSGSTGVPKGVAVPHRAVANFLTSMAQEPGLGPQDKVLSVTTVMFDIAVLELFLPLVTGASVVIASSDAVREGFPLIERLERGDITLMQATPTLWDMLLDAGLAPGAGLVLLAGGEPLPADLARRLTAGGAVLWNMYGPTETTIWSAVCRVAPGAAVTIGHPIGNTDLHILSETDMPLPPGVEGELNIGGDGLALGYYNRPDLTGTAFRMVTLNGHPQRLYRTGDLAKRLPSGEIVVLGRKDAQVKLRGFRIELGEIETRLRAMPGVDKAAVDLRARANGDKRLVAWLVAEAGAAPDLTAIAARLATELPDYMQPKAWTILPALPQTANGKLDRKALPEPEAEATAPAPVIHALPDLAPPEGPLEAQLLRIWAEVLGTEAIGVTQSLHDLGADSLSVFRIAARMLSDGLDLEARDLLAHPTIRALAAHAKGRAASGAEPARRPSLKDFRGGARRRAS